MYIYFLLIFLIFHHLRKSLLSQVLCYLFLSLFASFFWLFFPPQLLPANWYLSGAFFFFFLLLFSRPKITLQIFKYSNFLFIFFILLFYYIFCYLSHKKTKRAKTREKKSFTNYFNNLLFEKLSVCLFFFFSFSSVFYIFSYTLKTITNFRVVFSFIYFFRVRRASLTSDQFSSALRSFLWIF